MDSSGLDESLRKTSGDINSEPIQNLTQDECLNKNDAKMDEKNQKEFEEASAVVARHVGLLREYNEIKDVGQQLMGMVAEKRGVTVGSLYRTGEFGVGSKD